MRGYLDLDFFVRPSVFCIVFILTHSDQPDMKIRVNTGFCDAARFTWVMGFCHLFYCKVYGGQSCMRYFSYTIKGVRSYSHKVTNLT